MDGWDGGAGGGSIEITNTVLIKQDQRQQFWDDGVVARISCVKGQIEGDPQDLRKVKAGDSLQMHYSQAFKCHLYRFKAL